MICYILKFNQFDLFFVLPDSDRVVDQGEPECGGQPHTVGPAHHHTAAAVPLGRPYQGGELHLCKLNLQLICSTILNFDIIYFGVTNNGIS